MRTTDGMCLANQDAMRRAPFAHLALACALLLAVESTARADGNAATSELPAAPPPPPDGWYGWQTLLVDGSSIAVTLAGAAWASAAPGNGTGPDVMLLHGAGGFALGGPIVHLSHGHPWRALGDLGLRLGAVVGGGILGLFIGGAAAGSCSNSDVGCLPQAVAGGLVFAGLGVVTASAVDAAVFSYDRSPLPPPAPLFTLSPSFLMLKDGGAVGVRGTF